MIRIPEKKKFTIHEHHKGVKLTSKEIEVAINVVRRHRLLESPFTNFLQVDWCKAHNEARRLEHTLSKYVADPAKKALKTPLHVLMAILFLSLMVSLVRFHTCSFQIQIWMILVLL